MIIGLCGVIGAGKNSVGSILERDYNFTQLSFAGGVYSEVALAYGVTVEWLGDRGRKETPQPELATKHCKDANFVSIIGGDPDAPRSPREVLQKWGTEYRRTQSDSYWIDKVDRAIQASPSANFAITDVRFPNEATYIKKYKGTIVQVLRSVYIPDAATATHASEVGLAQFKPDFAISNFSTIDKLDEAVREFMNGALRR